MMDHGVSPRVHGNHKRTPINVLPLDTYQLAIRFLEEYLEKHAIKNKIKATHSELIFLKKGQKKANFLTTFQKCTKTHFLLFDINFH